MLRHMIEPTDDALFGARLYYPSIVTMVNQYRGQGTGITDSKSFERREAGGVGGDVEESMEPCRE